MKSTRPPYNGAGVANFSEKLATLATIGCRPIGSPANQAAADYIRNVFHSLGLAVEEQPYPCTGWDCRGG